MGLMEDLVKNIKFIEIPELHINDYVQVVRCKDCKYCNKFDYMCDHPSEWGNEDTRNHQDPEWYCADGKRKDSE